MSAPMNCKTCNRTADDPYTNEPNGETCSDACHAEGSLVTLSTLGDNPRPYVHAGFWRGYIRLVDVVFNTEHKAIARTVIY